MAMRGYSCEDVRRRWVTRFVAPALAATLIAAPAVAAAQGCYDLAGERDQVASDELQLIADHPGVHTMLVGCAATATSDASASNDKQSGSFFACVGVSCLFLGVGNCFDTAQRWYDLTLRQKRVEEYMRQQGC